MAPKTRKETRKTRNSNNPKTPQPGSDFDGSEEDEASASITQVRKMTDTNIGSVEKAREGTKFNDDDMELDQGSSSSQDQNLNPTQGNESPTQQIRDGLISTPGGVSSGVYADLEPQQWAAPLCPQCELEPTQDLRALRQAFAASIPTLDHCRRRREALEDMLSAVTLWDAELMKHADKLNEGLANATEEIILLTQHSTEHDAKRRGIMENITSTEDTKTVLLRELETLARRRAADLDKATRTVSLLQSLLQDTETKLNFIRPRHRTIEEEITHASSMVRTAAAARNAPAAPPKRVHSPPAQEGLAQPPKRPKAVTQDGVIVLDTITLG